MNTSQWSKDDIRSIAFGRLFKNFWKQIILLCGITFLFYGIGASVRHNSSVLSIILLLLSIISFVTVFITIYKFRVSVKKLTNDLLNTK